MDTVWWFNHDGLTMMIAIQQPIQPSSNPPVAFARRCPRASHPLTSTTGRKDPRQVAQVAQVASMKHAGRPWKSIFQATRAASVYTLYTNKIKQDTYRYLYVLLYHVISCICITLFCSMWIYTYLFSIYYYVYVCLCIYVIFNIKLHIIYI